MVYYTYLYIVRYNAIFIIPKCRQVPISCTYRMHSTKAGRKKNRDWEMGIKAHGTNKKTVESLHSKCFTYQWYMCFLLLSTGALVPTCSWRLRTAGTWGRGTTTSSKTSNRCFELRASFRDQPPSQRSIKMQRLEGVKSFFCLIFLMIFLGYLLFWSKRGSFDRGKFVLAKETKFF